jgi:class 3 adenylate cyclase/tetratricopeptide (TPR) repeat protein
VITCAECGFENPEDARFCTRCGAQLSAACLTCGRVPEPGDRFCANCGAVLPLTVVESGEEPIGYGERKRVTVLFADVVESTELVRSADPEEAGDLLRTAILAMQQAVNAYGGVVNEVRGDGIMALFGAPIAQEDHAVRAAYAALDLPETVAEATAGKCRTRVGVHSGEVLVRAVSNDLTVDYVAVGSTVHLAARLEQTATPGIPLLSATTARLAEGFLELSSRGVLDLRGFDLPVLAFDLVGRTEATTTWETRSRRILTTFVGRLSELSALQEAAERVRQGRGGAIAVEGGPGMGKSRLIHEFTSRMSSAVDLVIGQSTPYDVHTPYLVASQLIHGWVEAVGPDEIARLDSALIDSIPVIDRLMQGEDGEDLGDADNARRRRLVRGAVRALFATATRRRPLVIVVEDAHWIDDSSAALLSDLVDVAAHHPLLLVVTHRPTFTHNWEGKPHFRQLRLDTLKGADATRLVDAVLGPHPSVAVLRGRLLDRTDGTPLFLEETVRSLIEQGILAGEPGGLRVVGDPGKIGVPDSVNAAIAERVDRLDAHPKSLLQIASVVGMEVPRRLLQQVSGLADATLDDLVAVLVKADLLSAQTTPTDATFTFRHNLIREVVYTGIPLTRRRQLHGRTLEVLGPDGGVERLARHAHHARRWEEAAQLALAAARRSAERSAFVDTTQYLRWAFEALAALPHTDDNRRQAIDARIMMRVAKTGTGIGISDVLDDLDEAERLANRIGDTERLTTVNLHRSYAASTTGLFKLAITSAQRAAELAGQVGERRLIAEARLAEAQALALSGRTAGIPELLLPDLDFLSTQLRGQRHGMVGTRAVWSLAHLATHSLLSGRFDEADAYLARAEETSREHERPFDQAYLEWLMGVRHYLADEIDDAVGHFREAFDVAVESEMRWSQGLTGSYLASALVLAGRVEEALALIERVQPVTAALEAPIIDGWFLLAVGFARLAAGELSESHNALQRAVACADELDQPVLLAMAARVLAAHPTTPPEQGVGLMRRAVAASGGAGAVPVLAWSLLTMSEVLRRAGDTDGAAEALRRSEDLRRSMGMDRRLPPGATLRGFPGEPG